MFGRFVTLCLFTLLLSGCVSLDRPYAGTVPEDFNADVWAPSSEDPKAVIIALHSFGDYRVAYQEMGNWMATKGVAVYAYDQPGFGEHAEAGKWPGQEALSAALIKVVEQIRQLHPNTPLYLLGESMGADVAIITLAQTPDMPVAGLILSGPMVREGEALRYGENAYLNIMTALSPDRTMDVEGRAGDLSEEAKKRYEYDTGVLRTMSMEQHYGLKQLTEKATEAAKNIKAPVMILYGGKDEVVKPVPVCWLRHRLQGPASLLYYPEGAHLLLQTAGREERFSHIHQWATAKSNEDEKALDALRTAGDSLCQAESSKVAAKVESTKP